MNKLVTIAEHDGLRHHPDIECNFLFLGDWTEGLRDVGNNRAQINFIPRRNVGTHFNARQREQILNQTRHALGLHLHDLQEPLASLRIILGGTLQGFNKPFERRERRAQLMTGVRYKICAHPDEPVLFRQIAQHDQHLRDANITTSNF